MYTIKSTPNGVISRDASRDPADPAELHTTHSDPAERPEMRADPPEATELRETLSGSRRAPASVPTNLAASKRAPASVPTNLAASKRAPASVPTNLAASKEPPAAPPTILSDPENASPSSLVIPSHPENASEVHPTILSHLEDASAVDPTIPSHPENASSMDPPVHANPESGSGDDFEDAYQSLLPEMRALRRSQVKSINIGIQGAVTKALQVRPTLTLLMHRIEEVAPAVDPRLPQRLVTHALALRGYRTLAFDLQVLAELHRRCLVSNTGLTRVSAAELRRAQDLAIAIQTLLGRRLMVRTDIQAAADLRRRAFTLFVRVYDQTRRVVAFLRWREGDVDQLVPLLYEKRKDRKKTNTTNTTCEAQ